MTVVSVLLVAASVMIMAYVVESGDAMKADDRREAAIIPDDDGTIINGPEVTLAYDGPNSTDRLGIPYGGLPQAYSDTGPNVTNYMAMSGIVTFNMTYRGTGSFNVTLWADDGSRVAVLADETFDIHNTHVVTASVPDLPSGAYRVSVEASGYWFISIS